MISKTEERIPIEDVLPHVTLPSKARKRHSRLLLGRDDVNVSSLRLSCFKEKGIVCVFCGLEAQYFVKDYSHGDGKPHVNLYGINARGKEILFTKDHIFPKSRGGKDSIENMQTACEPCNQRKGHQMDVLPGAFEDISEKEFDPRGDTLKNIEASEKITVHGEINYQGKGPVHSDICPPKCDFQNLDAEHKKFLHDCLDEWIDKSGGTGGFYIKAEGYSFDVPTPIFDALTLHPWNQLKAPIPEVLARENIPFRILPAQGGVMEGYYLEMVTLELLCKLLKLWNLQIKKHPRNLFTATALVSNGDFRQS